MDATRRERIAKALADPRRWRILELARTRPGITCGEITADLGLSQPTVSHHIGTLTEAGLIEVRREGNLYRLTVKPCTLAEYGREISDFLE